MQAPYLCGLYGCGHGSGGKKQQQGKIPGGAFAGAGGEKGCASLIAGIKDK